MRPSSSFFEMTGSTCIYTSPRAQKRTALSYKACSFGSQSSAIGEPLATNLPSVRQNVLASNWPALARFFFFLSLFLFLFLRRLSRVLLVTVSIALEVLNEADIGFVDLIIRLTLIGCIQLILIKIFEVLFLLARLALRTVVNGTPALMLGDVLRQSTEAAQQQ
jgi:hypothetical protein